MRLGVGKIDKNRCVQSHMAKTPAIVGHSFCQNSQSVDHARSALRIAASSAPAQVASTSMVRALGAWIRTRKSDSDYSVKLINNHDLADFRCFEAAYESSISRIRLIASRFFDALSICLRLFLRFAEKSA